LTDGVLYYCKGSSQLKRKVVTAKEEAQQIFKEFHASAFGAHCGIVKTRDAITRRFYWPGMSKDIDKWVGISYKSRLTNRNHGVWYIIIVQYFTGYIVI